MTPNDRGALIDFWVSAAIMLAGSFLLAAVVLRPDPAESSPIKWADLQHRFSRDMVRLILCDDAPASCDAPAAARLLAIVDAARLKSGRAAIGEINRGINLAIRARADANDAWASPLETFERGTGDCEDYALAKLAALRLLGFANADLAFSVTRDARGEDHALLSVRLDGEWLTLDNRRMAMVAGLPRGIVFSGTL